MSAAVESGGTEMRPEPRALEGDRTLSLYSMILEGSGQGNCMTYLGAKRTTLANVMET